MKSLYIIALFTLSISVHAQSKITPESNDQDQTSVLRQAKEFEARMLKEAREKAAKKVPSTGLVSDHGIEAKQQEAKPQPSRASSGKLLPNTATLEEILATIPNRQNSRKASNSKNTSNPVAGLPNTATLEEIKKTIPKN